MTTADSASFTDRLRAAAAPIWKRQLEHPFVRALGDGTLPRQSFEFYIRQDARFLLELAKCFAFAATKTNDLEEMRYFGERLVHTLAVEQALHQEYGARFGLTPAEMMATPMAPSAYAYTRHLLSIAATGTLAALITAVLPCAWIYAEVGARFAVAPLADEHPYRDWIATYSTPEFAEVGAWLRAGLNERASALLETERRALEEIFLTSSRYELLFWEMAWRQEQWP